MSVGSVGASRVSVATQDRVATESKKSEMVPETASIADHVAAQDDHEPIRSASSTQGTLVDTYL